MTARRMAGHRASLRTGLVLLIIASGCGGAVVSPTPSPAQPTPPATATMTAAPTPTTTPSPPPSPSTAAISLYLRSWTIHPSIGPVNNFANAPRVISGRELLAVTYRATDDRVPLYTAPERRSLSEAALTTIVAEARNDGLLGTNDTFVCPPDENGGESVGGSGSDFLVLIVDRVASELTAACSSPRPSLAPGIPEPATWAAFQRFRTLLSDPSSWLGAEVGPPVAYDPDQLAVVVRPSDASAPKPNPADVVAWPLAGRFRSFGVSFAGERCAVVSGADAAALLTTVSSADADTAVRDGGGTFAQLIVRPLMPGEPDPCGQE
jgi:hypothetical protein